MKICRIIQVGIKNAFEKMVCGFVFKNEYKIVMSEWSMKILFIRIFRIFRYLAIDKKQEYSYLKKKTNIRITISVFSRLKELILEKLSIFKIKTKFIENFMIYRKRINNLRHEPV